MKARQEASCLAGPVCDLPLAQDQGLGYWLACAPGFALED